VKNQIRWSRDRLNEHGAAMVEFAIAIGIVITLLLGIIDLSIYYNGYTVARETARRMTKDAIVDTDFGLDTRPFAITETDPLRIQAIQEERDADTQKVQTARSRIIENSFNTFESSVLGSNTDEADNTNNNFAYRYTESGFAGTGFTSTSLDALLLRPGETVSVETRGSGSAETIIHPNCDSSTVDQDTTLCQDYMEIEGKDAWTFMQRNIPYYAEVRARVQTILFGTVEIKTRSIAWKDLTASNTLSDFADVPAPQTCAEAFPDPDTYCTENCGGLETCTFFPGKNVSQGCFDCQLCSEHTSAGIVCEECGGAGGNEFQACTFNLNEQNSTECGECTNRREPCTETDAQNACNGCEDNFECELNTTGMTNGENISNCGSCEPIVGTCTEEDAQNACGNSCTQGFECELDANGNVVGGDAGSCGTCVEQTGTCVSQNITAAIACNQCGGEAGNDLAECDFDGQNMTSQANPNIADCGGCVDRVCEESNPGLNNGLQSNLVNTNNPNCGCGDAEVCEFLAANNVREGCFHCRPLPCERLTQAELDADREQCEANNPGMECEQLASLTAGTCHQTDGFKTCTQREADGTISPDRCLTACNDPDQVCIELTDSRAEICIDCQAKPCPDRGLTATDTETERCTVIDGAPGADGECIVCTSKTCEETGETEANFCEELDCQNGFQCNFNPNADVGNCGGCEQCPEPDCPDGQDSFDGCTCENCLPTDCDVANSNIIGCNCFPLIND